jgi:gliding motility-associated-like protein
VVVADHTNPVISSCGATGTQNVNSNSGCNYTVSGTAWNAVATDNCGVSTLTYTLSGATTGTGTTLAGVSFNTGTTNVTWTATDAAGNTSTCNFSVVVTDNINPVVSSCGATGLQSVNANSSCNYIVNGTAWDAIATDNCGVSTLAYTLSGATTGSGTSLNGVSFNVGSTIVTWTVTDAAGNTASCNFTVLVKDNISPAISSCGATGTQNVNSNSGCNYTVSGTAWDAVATDNCGVSSLTYTLSGATTGTGITLNGVSFNSGTTMVTWTATDASGNFTTCTFNVAVADIINPVISSCGATGIQNVNSNSGCNYTVSGTAWDAIATDNCGVSTLTYTLSGATTGTGTSLNGVSFNPGNTIITWLVTDAAGNTANCNFTVNVTDITNPVISSCGATGIQNVNANSSCKYVVNGTAWDAIATDNCGVSTLAYTLSGATTGTGTSLNGISFNLGTTIVTWTATDAAGNTATCSFNVVVTDNTNPTITCSGPVTVNTTPGSCNVMGISLIAPVVSDNCSVSGLVNNAPFVYPVGITNVIWIVTDGSGNSNTCTQTVRVNATPLASNDIYSIPEDTPSPFNVLANDYDCDNNLNPSTVQVVTGPSHGTVNINTLTGVVTYTPNNNYNGNDQFNYTVCDSTNLCTGATVFITINGLNDPPITFNEHVTINENTPTSGSVLANGDYDPDGTLLFVNTTPLVGPSNGIFTINSSGVYNYTPANNYNGTDMVVVSVCDNGIPMPSACANDTIFITILPINNPPITFNEHFNTNQNVPVSGSVLANGDYDPDGTALNIMTTSVTGPSHGVIILNANGTFNYTPALNYYGTDMIVVNVCDNGIPMPSECAYDTIFLTINSVNLPPVTVNENIVICQNQQSSGNVLSNGDIDPDGTALSVSTPAVYGPLHGTFTINNIGDYTYTPTTGYFGSDIIVVNVCDNGIPLPSACSYDTLFVTVNQSSQANGGQDQDWCNENNTFLTGNLPSGSIGNWTQISGPNTVAISPANTSAVSVNGLIIGIYEFLYTLTTPNSNGACVTTDTVKVTNYHFPSIAYAGPDQFICYSGGQFTTTVLNGNIPTYGYGVWEQVLGPTVAVFADSLNHNTTISNLTTGEYGFNWVIRSGPCAPAYDYVHVKINSQPVVDAGPDGQICQGGVFPLTGAVASNYLSLQWNTTGTGTFSNPNSLNPVYTPSLADEGVGSVTLTLYADGMSICPDQSDAMLLTIYAIPPPLVCPPDTTVVTSSGLCSAYVNVPLTNLSISTNCITGIENSFNNTDNASGIYPLGTTTIFWTANYADGTSTTCAHTITVIDTIRPQITCPGDITQTITSGCNTNALIPTVNYADNCSVSSLTWVMTGATTASSPTTGFNQIGNYTFNPGLTVVTYSVTDPANNSTSCSFNVSIIDNVNPTITCPAPITINTLPGVCNANAVILGIPVTSDNCSVDTVTNNAPATFPIGTTNVIWTVTDGFGNTASCTQIVTVNSAPLAVNDSATTNEETPVIINVIANDIDCGNNLKPSTVTVVSPPSNGTTTVNPITGNITYNPNTNFYGNDQFNYNVCDSSGLCSTATVFITVLPINHPPVIGNEYFDFCQGVILTGSVLGIEDYDPEGMPLNVVTTPVSGPSHGTININSNGTFVYTSTPGYYGPDQVVVSVCDNGTPPPLNLPPVCSYDTIFINVNQIIPANAGPDQEWCNGANSFLIGNAPSGTSGSWIQISGPNTVILSPPNSAFVSVANMLPGTYQFVYTLTTISPTGNCTSTDTINVINYHLPSISYAGPDQVLCLGGGTTTSTTITANNPQYGYGVWEQVLGPTTVNYTDSLNQVTVVSNLAVGEYGFNWVIYNGICEPEYDYLHVIVNPTPLVNAGPDAQTCQGISYTLTGASASGYGSLQWYTSGTGSFSDPIAVNPNYTPSLADAVAGSVTLTLIGEGIAPCPDMTDAMVLTVTANPVFSCPSNIIQATDPGNCTATIVDTLPLIITNSGCITSVVNSFNSTNNASGIYPVGTTNIVWTITYLDGSVITCNQTITVTDSINPSVICSGNISQNIVSGCSTNIAVPVVQYSDNCTTTSLTWTMTGATSASSPITGFNQVGTHSFNVGVTTITYSVADSAGNITTCTSIVTVTDNINPTISCAGSITINSDPGTCSATGVLLTTPTTSDNCSVTSVTNNAPLSFPVGTTVVTWIAADSSGNTATCTQTVTVIGAPLAVNDYDTTSINTPVAVIVLANDLDCDNNLNPGSVFVNSPPSNGTVSVNPVTGVITYTPNNNYYGNDQFNYQVCDFTGFCSTATVFIGVGTGNNPPYVPDSIATVPEDGSITVCLPIIDGDGPMPYNLGSVGCYANGQANAIIAGNTVCITYIPNPNYNGLDSVCVVVCDGGGLCDTATLVIDVIPVNDPPFVPDTTITTPMDSTIIVCLPITDIDGNPPFSVSNIGCFSNGTASAIVAGGSVCITYIPDSAFVGVDSVCITVCDSAGACDTTIITINVSPPNARAIIGLAKEAGIPDLQADGSYNVNFLFTVKNLGNTKLTNVQVTDSLIAAFPAPVHFTIIVPPVSTGTLTANSNFNGITDVNLLVDTSSYINVGLTEFITLVVNVRPVGFFGPFYNSATSKALDTTGVASIDTSNNGIIVDPNGNGDPNEFGENTPTPIIMTPHSVIGIAKYAATPELQSDGSFNVAFNITVQNLGNDTLRNIIVTDDLATTFPGPAIFSVVSMPSVSGTLQPNSSFNGSTDINLLISTASILDTGTSATIKFTVNVIIPRGSQNTYYNLALGVANGNGTAITSDTSNNGYVTDPNDNGNPNETGENVSTPITLNSLDVFIPEGFSPNGDGINDVLVIRGLETYPENVFYVYNRWGNLIYQMKGYDNTWDGTCNSHNMNLGKDKVQPGTYFYILELNKDEKKPMNGYMVIQY